MPEIGYGRALDIRAPIRASRRDVVQSQMMASDPHDSRPDADTMMELLQRQYKWAFKIIQETDNGKMKRYGMTERERMSLEMAIQKHSYPFVWEGQQHLVKEFATIDQIGRYFTKVYFIAHEMTNQPKDFQNIPDTVWKF